MQKDKLFNRKGKIVCTKDFLYQVKPKYLRAIFSRFYPIYADNNYVEDMITYYGYCKEFAEVKEGDMAPSYNIVLRNEKIVFENQELLSSNEKE